MRRCLLKEQLKDVLTFKQHDLEIEDEDLALLVNGAENWQDSVEALTYLFAQIVERGNDDEQSCLNLINFFYDLESTMCFRVIEIDHAFVRNMMHSERSTSLSLEEQLIELQNRFGDHNYGRDLRRRY